MSRLVLGPLLRHVGTHGRDRLGRDRQPVRGRGPGLPRADLDRRRATTTRWSCVEGLRAGHAARRTRSAWTASWSGRWRTATRPPSRIRTLGADRPAAARVRLLPLRHARRGRPTTATSTPTPSTPSPGADGHRPERATGRTRCSCWATRSTPTRPPRRPRRRIRAAARHHRPAPGDQVADFEEYTWLYPESWTDPRRALAAVDDAELDDLRRPRRARRLEHLALLARGHAGHRLVAGADHRRPVVVLGLPAPGQPLPRRAGRATSCTSGCAPHDGDAEPLLREFAAHADREADGAKGAQLVVPARLRPGAAAGDRLPLRADPRRAASAAMVSDAEFAWIEEQVAGDYDHLLIGTSLPWLLPRALHDLESWDEVLCDGAPRPPAGPLRREGCAAPPTSSTGRRSGSPSTGSPSCSRRSAAATTPAGRHGAGHDLRAVRRRPPRLRRRRRTTASR